jgi:hypothetical protein
VPTTVRAGDTSRSSSDVGDFAFGVTDPSGTPVDDDGGAPIWGKVQDCATCHETRASSGFLFGVGLAHR